MRRARHPLHSSNHPGLLSSTTPVSAPSGSDLTARHGTRATTRSPGLDTRTPGFDTRSPGFDTSSPAFDDADAQTPRRRHQHQ
ncbi:hypothetical protein ACFQH6_00615 [Halobacteriaceae archaeon GCM10025711]